MEFNGEKKTQRISKKQKEKLVDYMSSNLEFARGQFEGLNGNINGKEMWESLSIALNSQGGSCKSVEQWKKCWTDLKSGVRSLVNQKRHFMNITGGGSGRDAPRDLNTLEEQILGIITKDAVDGDSCTPESGVEQREFHNESVYSFEILDGEEICPPQPKIKKKSPSTSSITTESRCKEAMAESRKMHSDLLSILENVQKQNLQILIKISEIEQKINK